MAAPMSRIVLLALLAVLYATVAGAEGTIYRWVDQDGKVHFGDRPPAAGPRGEITTLPAINIVTPAETAPSEEDEDTTPAGRAVAYSRFEIVSPRDDEAVRANDGNVTITLGIEPALFAGHVVRLVLDGDEAARGSGLQMTLNNLDRGTHTLAAEVIGRDGRVIVQTPALRFHVLRAAIKPAP